MKLWKIYERIIDGLYMKDIQLSLVSFIVTIHIETFVLRFYCNYERYMKGLYIFFAFYLS